MKLRFILMAAWTILHHASFAQENTLASGAWLKFAIPDDGVYRIDASELNDLPPIPTDQLRILSLPGGPLPQEISKGNPPLLTDLPAYVSDDGNGFFDGSDYVLFFAEGPDILRYQGDDILYTYNPYSRQNYIFVGFNGTTGKIIT